MPWDWLGNWVDDPTRAPDQQFAANPWGQAQGAIRQAEETIMQAMAAQQAYGGVQAQQQTLGAVMGRAQPQRPRFDFDNMVGILDEFNTAFQHGIREVIVEPRIFAQLAATINRMYDMPDGVIGNHLQIATAGGRLTVRSDGPKMPTAEDFDRYMEDVDGNAP